jgi:ferredoxin-NADP reductase
LKKGATETLYTQPPENSVVVCLDEMGPLSTRVYAGKELVKPRASDGKRAERAKHELCYERTEQSGYVCGPTSFVEVVASSLLLTWLEAEHILTERFNHRLARHY